MNKLCIASQCHNLTGTGNANCDIDEWAYYSSVLTTTKITALYNSGAIKAADLIDNTALRESLRFDINNNITSTSNLYSSATITGGTTPLY